MRDGELPDGVAAALAVPASEIVCGDLDRALVDAGMGATIGVDEAGRGPLAGPLVAAAVRLPAADDELFALLDDSKKLTDRRRRQAVPLIRKRCAYRVIVRTAEDIDGVGIQAANHGAMRAAVRRVDRAVHRHAPTDVVLVDGYDIGDIDTDDGRTLPTLQVVKGDRRSLAIAAASILAKTSRDDLMLELDATHPGYGFARHKGYGTSAHVEALRQHGPIPGVHRFSFAPVRDCHPS